MKISSRVPLLVLGYAAVTFNTTAKEVKQLFHVTGSKAWLDNARSVHPELDIWEVEKLQDDQVQADIYTYESVLSALKPRFRSLDEASSVTIKPSSIDLYQQIKDEKATADSCHRRTTSYLDTTPAGTKYTDNAFFDCWRTSDQIFQYMDKLTSENPNLVTKINRVSTTVEGRDIPAYKISTGKKSKAIYTESLIHAREWHSGAVGIYAFSSFLDALRSNDHQFDAIFNDYDLYYVPIVNIDGYRYTWEKDRMWRKNRRQNGESSYGVDLNRNFGPAEYFDKDGASSYPDGETYPGTGVLSEPETKGIVEFLKSIDGFAGALDYHTYSALILRPFGNQENEAPEPYGSKLKALGDSIRDAIQKGNNAKYTSQTSQALYYAYGTFTDSIFLGFNNTPSFTFELEGRSFVQPTSTIRPVGRRITQGTLQFAAGLTDYYS